MREALHRPTRISCWVRGNSLSRQRGTQTHFLWNKCNTFLTHHKTTTHSSFTALRKIPFACLLLVLSFLAAVKACCAVYLVHFDGDTLQQSGSLWSVLHCRFSPSNYHYRLTTDVWCELSAAVFEVRQLFANWEKKGSQHLVITVKTWLIHRPWILKTALSVNGDSRREKTQVAGFLQKKRVMMSVHDGKMWL